MLNFIDELDDEIFRRRLEACQSLDGEPTMNSGYLTVGLTSEGL
jgi:hypothetical protein